MLGARAIALAACAAFALRAEGAFARGALRAPVKGKAHVSADSSREPFRTDRGDRLREEAPSPTPLELRLSKAIIAEAISKKYWGKPFCWVMSRKHVEGCSDLNEADMGPVLKVERTGAVEDVRVRTKGSGADPAAWDLALSFDPTTRYGLFCAGYSLQVLLQVMRREDLFREMTTPELRSLRSMWFGWNSDVTVRGRLMGRLDVARRQSELALTSFDLGKRVGLLPDGRPRAIPGDFLVFRFDSGALHTGLFDRWVYYQGKLVGVGFIGANLEGVGRKFYCFRDDLNVDSMPRPIYDAWCSSKPRVRRAAIFAVRLSPTLTSKAR
jgi:hypothetical protein